MAPIDPYGARAHTPGPPSRFARPRLHLRRHKGGHATPPSGASSDRHQAVDVHTHLLAENDRHAAGIRRLLADHGVFAANLMSSPGSGKTALLEATLGHPGLGLRLGVIEGDIETSADADRLAPFGVPVIQINTGPFGGDCHLAAPLVAQAIRRLDVHELDVLVVENVGNLVCPAEFDIGEHAKVVLLSVTEGEDKPLKYPLMFHEASLAVVTKVDLLPHLDASLDLIEGNIRRVNPTVPILPLSARTGEGLAGWIEWLVAGANAAREESHHA